MYCTIQASDPFFFAKILFAIDSALQSHWRSSSLTSDRLSVNDRVLQMTDIQDSILRMSFNQTLPKPIIDKISNYLESNLEKIKDRRDGKNGKLMVETVMVMSIKIMEVTLQGNKTSFTILINLILIGD
jgi:hypothetical protein